MNNQVILILIAIAVLVAVLFAIPSGENFSEQVFTSSKCVCPPPHNHHGSTPLGPPTDLPTCAPDNGDWSTPGGDKGITTLNSPCCNPNNGGYRLQTGYKTCADDLDPTDDTERCILDCCGGVAARLQNDKTGQLDSSWGEMARCGCSLYCYNKSDIHFKKYGSALQYIDGEPAIADSPDTPDFIGSGRTFSGE